MFYIQLIPLYFESILSYLPRNLLPSFLLFFFCLTKHTSIAFLISSKHNIDYRCCVCLILKKTIDVCLLILYSYFGLISVSLLLLYLTVWMEETSQKFRLMLLCMSFLLVLFLFYFFFTFSLLICQDTIYLFHRNKLFFRTKDLEKRKKIDFCLFRGVYA